MCVKVIMVVMGIELDQSELCLLLFKKDNSFKEDCEESFKQFGDRIMKEVVKCKFYVLLFGFLRLKVWVKYFIFLN